MKNILLSGKYLAYALIAFIYAGATYFPFDYNCLRDGSGGFCGIITGILNAPSLVIVFPLLILLDTTSLSRDLDLMAYYAVIVLGWLVLGACISWIIQRTRISGMNNPSIIDQSFPKEDDSRDKILIIFYWIGIASIIGGLFLGIISFIAIPIVLITIPAFIIRMNQASKKGDSPKSNKYLFLILLPFVTLGLVVFTASYII